MVSKVATACLASAGPGTAGQKGGGVSAVRVMVGAGWSQQGLQVHRPWARGVTIKNDTRVCSEHRGAV